MSLVFSDSVPNVCVDQVKELLRGLELLIHFLYRNCLKLSQLLPTIKRAMSRYESNNFEESSLFSNQGPTSLLERLGYVKQLVYSKTKLEFRLLWNKIFQKEDDELSWLLNPLNANQAANEATMMKSFNKEADATYQYGSNDVSSALGREKVTIYSRELVRRADQKGGRSEREKKSLGESALDIARCMGMGVYMTSTSFPSPFVPINENQFHCGETFYDSLNTNTLSKIW